MISSYLMHKYLYLLRRWMTIIFLHRYTRERKNEMHKNAPKGAETRPDWNEMNWTGGATEVYIKL